MATMLPHDDADDREYQRHRQQFLTFAHGMFTAAGLILFGLLMLAWFVGGDPTIPT